jgi:hypothetical protein
MAMVLIIFSAVGRFCGLPSFENETIRAQERSVLAVDTSVFQQWLAVSIAALDKRSGALGRSPAK